MGSLVSVKEKILFGFDIPGWKGLEIGPLVSPLIQKEEGDVRYVDRASTSELREWYGKDSKINPEEITEIDYIWGDSSLAVATGHSAYFDYCVAAHVIEHVPDLIGWLQEISTILKVGGVASFSIPDRRYTFDYLRSESTLSDCIDAYLCKRRKPSIRHIFDHFSNHVEIDLIKAWEPAYDGADLVPGNTLATVYSVCKKALDDDSYIDSHCWVFTKDTFVELISQLNELDLINFKIREFFDVELHGHEFVIQLEKMPDNQEKATKNRLFLESYKKCCPMVVSIEMEANIAGTAQLYYDSGDGFNEVESLCVFYDTKKGHITFTLPVLSKKIKALRFDPAKNPVKMSIYSLSIAPFSDDFVTVPFDCIQANKHIRTFSVRSDRIIIKGSFFSDDPSIIITVPDTVLEKR